MQGFRIGLWITAPHRGALVVATMLVAQSNCAKAANTLKGIPLLRRGRSSWGPLPGTSPALHALALSSKGARKPGASREIMLMSTA
jgi:hypothetical protein